MKVGILTFHRTLNYGAILQCYGLCRAVKALGHEPEVIDYQPFLAACEYLKYVLRSRYMLGRIGQYRKMQHFLDRYLPLSPRRYWSSSALKKAAHPYDLIICGSDEIWNLDKSYLGHSGAYFLDFVPGSRVRKASYAASFGSTAALNGRGEEIKNYLRDFRRILVRDASSQKLVEGCGWRASKVADPTFLSPFDEVEVPPRLSKKYLLVYAYRLSSAEEDFIRDTARGKGLYIVSIGHVMKGADENRISVSPGEWVGYFRSASYVVTSFYHGTIFSILSKKPFNVLTKSKKVLKTMDLLQDLGLQRRVFDPKVPYEQQRDEIDYAPVSGKVEEKTAFSRKCLSDLLGPPETAGSPALPAGDARRLHETVIAGGYCIGCGACASVEGSPFVMRLDAHGRLQATPGEAGPAAAVRQPLEPVCPFSEKAADEDEIAKGLFSEECRHDPKIGYHLAVYGGFVKEGPYRADGSSGGMGSWILTRLLKEDLIDAVIHIRQRAPTDGDPRLFQYQISTTTAEIASGAKSRYYPIEMSEVLRVVRDRPGRYAIVGIPCFIKAVRLLTRQDALLKERIAFCVGLVCGHLKSAHFAKMIAWQSGLDPDRLTGIDFRKKIPGADANRYAVEVHGTRSGNETTVDRASKDIYGSDWGTGFFKYKACDFCDDVLAETADITVGDAWLPQYVKDWKGTNVLVVRHPALKSLLERGVSDGALHLDVLGPQDAARSQDAGLRHRRDGLAYRLYLTDQKNEWRPPKRVQPSADGLDARRQRQQVLRMEMASKSHTAFRQALDADKFSVFTSQMDPLLDRYYALYRSAWKNAARRIKRSVLRTLQRVR